MILSGQTFVRYPKYTCPNNFCKGTDEKKYYFNHSYSERAYSKNQSDLQMLKGNL